MKIELGKKREESKDGLPVMPDGMKTTAEGKDKMDYPEICLFEMKDKSIADLKVGDGVELHGKVIRKEVRDTEEGDVYTVAVECYSAEKESKAVEDREEELVEHDDDEDEVEKGLKESEEKLSKTKSEDEESEDEDEEKE